MLSDLYAGDEFRAAYHLIWRCVESPGFRVEAPAEEAAVNVEFNHKKHYACGS